jgi:hypothetical protein
MTDLSGGCCGRRRFFFVSFPWHGPRIIAPPFGAVKPEEVSLLILS